MDTHTHRRPNKSTTTFQNILDMPNLANKITKHLADISQREPTLYVQHHGTTRQPRRLINPTTTSLMSFAMSSPNAWQSWKRTLLDPEKQRMEKVREELRQRREEEQRIAKTQRQAAIRSRLAGPGGTIPPELEQLYHEIHLNALPQKHKQWFVALEDMIRILKKTWQTLTEPTVSRHTRLFPEGRAKETLLLEWVKRSHPAAVAYLQSQAGRKWKYVVHTDRRKTSKPDYHRLEWVFAKIEDAQRTTHELKLIVELPVMRAANRSQSYVEPITIHHMLHRTQMLFLPMRASIMLETMTKRMKYPREEVICEIIPCATKTFTYDTKFCIHHLVRRTDPVFPRELKVYTELWLSNHPDVIWKLPDSEQYRNMSIHWFNNIIQAKKEGALNG